MRCEQCRKVIDVMSRLFRTMPDLSVNYKKRFTNNSSSRYKFFNGCHVLQEPDLEVWIWLVLSAKPNYPDSFKRRIDSLDYIPESGLAARLKEGERMFKRTKTQADKPSARAQENPSLIS